MKYAAVLVALLATTVSALVECESPDDCDSKTACCGYVYEDDLIQRACSNEGEEDPDLTELAEQGYEAAEFSCYEPEDLDDDEEGASRLAYASVAALGLLYMA